MKSTLLTAIAALLVALPVVAQQPLTTAERQRAIDYLEKTKKRYLELTSGLTDAQWRFKADAASWSIAECAEHLALTEDNIHNGMQKQMERPRATPEDLAKAAAKDARIVPEIVDRTAKREAPPQIRPTNRWPTREETIRNFVASRDRSIAYLRTTNDDLQGHLAGHATLGPITAFQWYIAMSAHTERHLDQAAEVQRDPKYPR